MHEREHLREAEFGYAASLLLFTLLEKACYEAIGNDNLSLKVVINRMCDDGLIDEAERILLNEGDSSIREIRNKLVHKDLYQYGVEMDGIMYPFGENETWLTIYDMYVDRILLIMSKI